MIKHTQHTQRKINTSHKVIRKTHEPEPVLRFCPLGGFEEIGRNCVFFEYKNEIVIVRAGIRFPE